MNNHSGSRILPVVFSGLFALSTARAESSVWKVEEGDAVMYLGGTIHLLRPSDFPLPPEFEAAYQASEVVVFETDVGKSADPSTQMMLLAKGMSSDGSTLEKRLSPEVHARLAAYCAANGIPLPLLQGFKPSFVALTLAAKELLRLGVSEQGVDVYFYRLANKDGKTISMLETIEEQIDYITSMGADDEDALIRYTIESTGSLEATFDRLVAAWKTGNDQDLHALLVSEVAAHTPQIYREIFVDRNRNWMPKIDAYGKTPATEFILVGAGHLVGPDGILAALQDKGYQVTKP